MNRIFTALLTIFLFHVSVHAADRIRTGKSHFLSAKTKDEGG